MDQLLTPRGLVLTLASLLEGGVGCGNPVRLRARGSFLLGVICFFLGWCACAVLCCLFCYLFLFFFGLKLLDTCPFLGKVSGTGVCRGSILGPEILST